MKRILSLVLALSMVLSMFTVAFAGTTPEDVAGKDCEFAVSALIELGIVNGYEDGTYKANKIVSRAEMAKLLVVAAGLEPAAELNKGATKFSDVPASHWATGYINVAAEYGFINGYPDGTFAPDKTVSYAEAVTMSVRVLGYKSVVESKGTWPTNYISKAQELKLLEDVSYNKYNDGAVRGNVAILMWNMLDIPMWDITGENETNGVSYSNKNGTTMLDKYFSDFEYIDEDDELFVSYIDVKDGEVSIKLATETYVASTGKYYLTTQSNEYELAEGIDFLNLYGRKVSYLYNKDEEKIVMITASADDKVVNGYKDELDEDNYSKEYLSGYQLWGESGDRVEYVSTVIGNKKNVKYATAYDMTETIIVDSVKAGKNDTMNIKPIDGGTLSLDEDVLVIRDGKWCTPEDIEAGDVVTELVKDELYVVSSEKVTGSFDDISLEETEDDERVYIVVDGDEYVLSQLGSECKIENVFEIDEDGDELSVAEDAYLEDILEDEDNRFYDEDCTVYLNFLGEVVRIEFEEVDVNEDDGDFYVVTNVRPVWEVAEKSGVKAYIELNGEDYEIKSSVVGDDFETFADDFEAGMVVYAEFDSKDRIDELVILDHDGVVGGEYTFVFIDSGDTNSDEILDKNNYISGEHKVTSATTVYTIKAVEDEEDELDHYEVKATKGVKEVEGVEAAIVGYKTSDTFKKAAYVFTWDDAKNSDISFGILSKLRVSKGNAYLTIDGKEYKVDMDANNYHIESANDFIVFSDDEDGIIVRKVFSIEDDELYSGVRVVNTDDGRQAEVYDYDMASTYDIDLDIEEDEADDYTVIFANIRYDVNEEEYYFVDWEEIDYSDIKLKEDDMIYSTQTSDKVDVIVIARGFDSEDI